MEVHDTTLVVRGTTAALNKDLWQWSFLSKRCVCRGLAWVL